MSTRPPLTGLRIVELTTAWAGPMAGRILAFLGADVIHVEHATRPDLWRQHGQAFRPRLYPDREGGQRPYNRNALFNSQNLGKRSLCLDIKRPSGREIMDALLRESDVLVANFAPGALERAGLGELRLRDLNPRLIVVEMPAYGNAGPTSRAGAVGLTMEMASGMASLTGYPDGAPVCTGPHYMDPIGAYNAAAAILTALHHRAMTGRGQYVEVPQVEAAMQYIGAELLHAAATGIDPERLGNRVPWAAPHDVYPALGEDEWLAIAVIDDACWRGLCTVVPGLTDPSYAGLAGRLAGRAAIDVVLTQWSRLRPKADAAATLQAVGVPAAPVLGDGEVAGSAFLAARAFFHALTHGEAGTHRYPGVPIHLSRTPGVVRTAAPCLGEHTAEILAELGLSETQIEMLDREGTTSATPP